MTTRAHVPAGTDVDLQALEEALRVMPSPEFVARVRERVGQEPMGAAIAWWLKFAFAGAAAMAVLTAAALWNGRTVPERAGVANRTMAQTSAVASAQSQGREPSRTPSRASDSPSSRLTTTRVTAAPLIIRRAAVREQPREVLVPDDERRALDRLLIAIQEGRAAVPALRRVLEDENGCLLEPRPIDIPLMKPIEPLSGTAADRSGSKDK